MYFFLFFWEWQNSSIQLISRHTLLFIKRNMYVAFSTVNVRFFITFLCDMMKNARLIKNWHASRTFDRIPPTQIQEKKKSHRIFLNSEVKKTQKIRSKNNFNSNNKLNKRAQNVSKNIFHLKNRKIFSMSSNENLFHTKSSHDGKTKWRPQQVNEQKTCAGWQNHEITV